MILAHVMHGNSIGPQVGWGVAVINASAVTTHMSPGLEGTSLEVSNMLG